MRLVVLTWLAFFLLAISQLKRFTNWCISMNRSYLLIPNG